MFKCKLENWKTFFVFHLLLKKVVMKNAHHFASGDTRIGQKRSINSVRDSVNLGIQTFRAKNNKNYLS